MVFNSPPLYRLVSIRILSTVLFVWFALFGSVPAYFQSLFERLDQQLLIMAVDYFPNPTSRTPITIIHVPDLIFDSWQADIGGAEGLLRILNKTNPDETVVAFLADEPVKLIQGRAEKLLGKWVDNRLLNPKSFRELAYSIMDERNQLLIKLKENVIFGIAGKASQYSPQIGVEPYSPVALPAWISNHLWSMADGFTSSIINSSIVHYPLPLNDSLSQPLIYQQNIVSKLSFIGRFLQVASQNSDIQKDPLWKQEVGLFFDDKSVRVGYNGQIVPLYGEALGIKAPVVQLTLSAALRLDHLSGWIIIGRNESHQLTAITQALAAIGDDAFIVTPLYFPVIKIILLSLLFLWILFLSPRVTFIFSLFGAGIFAIMVVVAEVALPRLSGFWLPMADLLVVMLVMYILVALWRVKYFELSSARLDREQWALQAAKLNYQMGDFTKAADAIAVVPLTRASLKWYYLIAYSLLQKNNAEKSKPLWASLYRKARKFKDVEAQVSACEKILKERIKKPEMPTDTSIICIDAAFDKLGRYQVGEVIGHGDSGVVYKGYDPVITKNVAIKTLNLNAFNVVNQEKIKAEFIEEIKIFSKLMHPNIAAVYDIGQEANWLYLAMDFARGKPLTDYLNAENLLPVAESYRIVLKVAEALAFAHRIGVVHCELKPTNILYDRESGDVKVTDFGIAKWLDVAQSETEVIMGSPFYVAPEQLQARPLSAQTDIFRLGAVFYQLLTGELPFKGKNLLDVQDSILYSRPHSIRSLRPELPASATRIVNRALKKKTAERFHSASDMAFALTEALARDFKTEAKLWRLI